MGMSVQLLYDAYSWKFCTRFLYDLTINCFCREVLLCIAPIALSTSDRNDLIKDCLAIFFITKLDDIDDPDSIMNCLKKLFKKEENDRKGPKDVEDTEGQHDMEKQPLVDSRIEDRLERLEKRLGRLERRED